MKEETQPEYCNVSWFYDGTLLLKQELQQGTKLEVPELSIPGYRIHAWESEDGVKIAPLMTVDTDLSFSANVLPALDNHVPYLFPDEYGFIRPASPLTGEEFSTALAAVVSKDYTGTVVYPDVGDTVTTEALGTALSQFFTEDELDGASPYITHSEAVTRQEFCAVMNKLTGRDSEEPAKLTNGSVAPADINEKDTYRNALLEATVEHIHISSGSPLPELSIPSNLKPGYFWIDGWLYRCDNNGYLYKDCTEDSLYYDVSGRYTCGSVELDELVVKELVDILDANPGADRLELLRALYEHFRHDFRYLGRHTVGYEGEPWETEAAIIFLSKRSGDCRNYAAAFTAMARGLGYPAITHVRNDRSSHSWTEITIDGTPYIFDPQLASVKHDDRFMIPYTPGHYLLPTEVENGGADELAEEADINN